MLAVSMNSLQSFCHNPSKVKFILKSKNLVVYFYFCPLDSFFTQLWFVIHIHEGSELKTNKGNPEIAPDRAATSAEVKICKYAHA